MNFIRQTEMQEHNCIQSVLRWFTINCVAVHELDEFIN